MSRRIDQMRGVPATWGEHTSSSSLYVVRHPRDWKVAAEDNQTSIWKPHGQVAVTVSAFLNEVSASGADPRKMLSSFIGSKSAEDVVTRTSKRNIASASYRDEDGDRWIATVLCSGPGLVLATVNGAPDSVGGDEWLDALKVVESIRLLTH